MKRIVSCTCIMALAVSLTLFLSVIAGTKAEAASSAEFEAARQKKLEAERKREEEAQKPIAARSAKVLCEKHEDESKFIDIPEFIAISESEMNWEAAKAYCQKHGGRLPRINYRNSWNGKDAIAPGKGILINGFGCDARPWSEVGLPNDFYWTDTALADRPGYLWVVSERGDYVYFLDQRLGLRVVCVP